MSAGIAGTRRAWWVRVVATLLVLLTAWHVFASFLWIFPPSPLRQLTPGSSLSSYMLPLFGQSWSVFAPEPINGDHHFNVRAQLAGAEGTTTGWVSATDVELSMVIYNLFPPRAGIQAEGLAGDYKRAWEGLSAEQREVVASDYTTDDWLALVESDLQDAEEGDKAIDDYVAVDRVATAYATQVAKAIWGDDVVAVQYRVSRQNVVPFAQRNDPNASKPDPTIILPGWRDLQIEEGQSQERFTEVFLDQYRALMEARKR